MSVLLGGILIQDTIRSQAAELRSKLDGMVNMLIIDDREEHLFVLTEMFESSVFNLYTAASYHDAVRIIQSADHPWHCWIADFDLGFGRTGNDFLEKFKGFPYVVIVSALGSMEDAATAMISGAQGVFDKDPESLERMFETVCKVAATGFILRGKGSDYLSTFLLLANPAIQTPQDWGAAAGIGPRQLEKICKLYTCLSPKRLIKLFHSVLLLLLTDSDLQPYMNSSSVARKYSTRIEHLAESLVYVGMHLDEFPQMSVA